MLIDYTGLLYRQGKASISVELAGIFERLLCSQLAESDGEARRDRLLSRYFASSRAMLIEIADRLGVRHLVNLRVCPVR
jgi:hypothetical protein